MLPVHVLEKNLGGHLNLAIKFQEFSRTFQGVFQDFSGEPDHYLELIIYILVSFHKQHLAQLSIELTKYK